MLPLLWPYRLLEYVHVSLLGRAALFCLRELARPALEECGKHIGDAAGTVLGKKIDPEHGEDPEDKKEKEKKDAVV